jgi:hypothetical protein
LEIGLTALTVLIFSPQPGIAKCLPLFSRMNALMPREMPLVGALIGKFTGEASQERQQLL